MSLLELCFVCVFFFFLTFVNKSMLWKCKTYVKQKNSVVDPTKKKVAADTGT